MRPFSSKLLLAATIILLAAPVPMPPMLQDAPPGLEDLFETGAVLQDRNGDGHVDFVAAHLVLGAPPSDDEVAAAANIAARLGFETSAMNLPITRDGGGLAIAVGQAGLGRLGASAAGLGVDLEPGIGVVTTLDGAVAVVGGDGAGTLAAAGALSARVPHLWDPEGPTMADVLDTVRSVLADAEVQPVRGVVRRILVEAGRPGLRRLDLEIEVPATAVPAADTALREAADSLQFDGLQLLRIYLSAPGETPVVIHASGAPDAPEAGSGRRPGGGAKSDLDLANLFTNQGLLGDSDQNLIPDRVDVVLSAAGDVTGATADLAARIGLEATGIAIPLAKPPAAIDDPESEPTLVLIGQEHPLIAQLIEEGKLVLPPLVPGQGHIRVVDDAFGEKRALVILGADDAGLERAVRQVAERFPHVWDRGKDRVTMEDVRHDVWMALSSRSPVGQAATAVYKLDRIAADLATRDLERVTVQVHLERAAEGLEAFLERRLTDQFSADELDVSVGTIDVQNGDVLIDEEIEIASEVDAFWSVFREDVLPRVRSGVPVVLEGRVSEPPEIRAEMEREARAQLAAAGADPDRMTVHVISAYKQGYSWLNDVVGPALAGQAVDRLTIRFAELGAPEGWPQQAMYTPTRWLLEIFPIDEILARDFGIPLDRIAFEKMPLDAPAYEVVATSAGGDQLYRETFEPAFVLRPYFDRFPDYEMARVTTGWITARVGDETVTDRRIITDLERFWDHFQSNTLMQVYDYVMRIGEGKPSAADAPHFGELRVDVTLSEPDYQIGVDKEQVASMEALHEEIYFGTLHFFDVLGRMARGQNLNYPGRVIPIVRPKSDGEPGRAKITFTGFGAARPMVEVTYQERGTRPVRERRDLMPVTLDPPEALGATVQDGSDGIERLDLRVQVNFEKDRRDEFILRTSAQRIDRSITSAEQMTAVLTNVGVLRDAGLYHSALAYPGFGALGLSAYWGHEFDADSQTVAAIAGNGVPEPPMDIADLLPRRYEWDGEELVQWETPIPPPEAADVLARMASAFPEATSYQVGESYLGKRIWAMDLMAPVDASHWSQAKMSTLKPTVIYSARQHANEVSSTSHVLKLAELILTDSAYASVLDKVNVVIHPITNPDGAQLAYDLYQITPDHMLHAGYLGSLGVDVSSGQGDDDPIYPETKVRPKLWNTWLPDIFLNPHGYPSHEWVQIFSEYAGWVRNRATQSRGWWGMRGWFMPSFGYVDSPDFPDHKAAAFEIRDRITKNVTALPAIRALNERAYDRYRRYGFAQDTENFKMDFTNDVLIYTSITGSSGRGGGTMSNPRVTIWSGTTEAPDETAYGEWMQLVASAGLQWDKALLEYLLEGNHQIDRTETGFAGGVAFKIHRPRPATAEEDDTEVVSSGTTN